MAPRSELTPALRERICELHDAAGWGYKRIQKRYPFVSLSGIRYTIKKDRERIGGVTKPRSGRPRKLDEADQEKLKRAIAENPKITREDMLAEVSYKVKLIIYGFQTISNPFFRLNTNLFAVFLMLRI